MLPFAFLPNLGTTELMVVAFVSLLIFGNRLPSVMRSLGKSVTEFKKGVAGIEEDIDTAAAAWVVTRLMISATVHPPH